MVVASNKQDAVHLIPAGKSPRAKADPGNIKQTIRMDCFSHHNQMAKTRELRRLRALYPTK